MDQTGATGIWATALGYAINARPGPVNNNIVINRISNHTNYQILLCEDFVYIFHISISQKSGTQLLNVVIKLV